MIIPARLSRKGPPVPSSSNYHNTSSTLSAIPTQQPAPYPTADGFQFAQPYTHTPAWAHSAITNTPASSTPVAEPPSSGLSIQDKPTADSEQPAQAAPAISSINDLLDAGGRTSTAELFRQPLKPQDYRASSAFVHKVISQLLETVDHRRPFGHLRGFVTPDIMDIVEQFSTGRSRAIMKLAGPSRTIPGAPAMQPAPLRLLRLHLRARRLNPQESTAARALERSLPPGYQAAVRPGQQPKPTSAITADADLRVEVCGTYRDGARVKAFAGAAERCASKWRLTSFNFV